MKYEIKIRGFKGKKKGERLVNQKKPTNQKNLYTLFFSRLSFLSSGHLSPHLQRRDSLGLNALLDTSIHIILSAHRLDRNHSTLLPKLIHHRHASLDESAEALLDRLDIVIIPAGRLAALQEARLEHILRTVQEERKLGRRNGLLEENSLVELAGESIDQETRLWRLLGLGGGFSSGAGAAALGQRVRHGVRQQRDGDLHRHDLALLDVVPDQVAVLTALADLLGAQQVSGRQVREAVVANEVLGLRALTGARAAEDEDDLDLVGAEAGGVLG